MCFNMFHVTLHIESVPTKEWLDVLDAILDCQGLQVFTGVGWSLSLWNVADIDSEDCLVPWRRWWSQRLTADLIDAICGRMQMATQTWVMIMRSRCQGLAGSDLMSTEHKTRQVHVVQGNGMSLLACLRQDVRKQDGAQEPFMLYCQTQTMATQIWTSPWSWKGTSKTTSESSMCICCRVAYFDYFDLLLKLMLENAKWCKTFMSEHIRYWPAPHSEKVVKVEK